MMKILSIDFDYFIAVTSTQRDKMFPNGCDEIHPAVLRPLWEKAYEEHEDLSSIGVIDNFTYVKDLLYNYSGKLFIRESHKDIKCVIDRIPVADELEVINIDFHHDYYHYFSNGNEYNCGNWVRRLLEDRPNTKVSWIRREDSQLESLDGEVPFNHTTDITILNGQKFDYIFICLSPEWTPPHLDPYFNELHEEVISIC